MFVVVLVVSCAWMLFTPYEPVILRTAALDDGDWDVDENTGNGEFDSYEEFESDDPADSVVTPESNGEETGRQG